MPFWVNVLGVLIPLLIAIVGLIGTRNAAKRQAESDKTMAALSQEKVDREAFVTARDMYSKLFSDLNVKAEADRRDIERLEAALAQAHKLLAEQKETLTAQREEIDTYRRERLQADRKMEAMQERIEGYRLYQERTERELAGLRRRLAEVEVTTLHMQEDRLFGDQESGE